MRRASRRSRATAGLALGLALGLASVACDPPGAAGGSAVRAEPMLGGVAKRMEQYDWLASNSGPRGCPMHVLDGDFLSSGGGSLYIPRAAVHSGWGRDVSVDVVGADTKPLPDSAAVLFFSYLEDKLYRAAFALPRDSIARLFREGFEQRTVKPYGRATYNVLVAGVAPGGAVAVWASGSERQVEVYFGRAEAVELDWHRAFEMPPKVDRRKFVAASLAESAEVDPLVSRMARDVPAFERWAGYRARYRWRPAFEGVGAPAWLNRAEYVNGERENVEVRTAGEAPRPAPRYLPFRDPGSGRYYEPQFDEDEVAAAFARAGAGGRAVELVFAAPPAGAGDPRVLVRSAADTVALRQVTFLR